jgi:predicted transcriptional regulator
MNVGRGSQGDRSRPSRERKGRSEMPTARKTRLAAGYSMEKAAVLAGVTSGTLRLYEASEDAVSVQSRGKLDRFFAQLRAMLVAERAP